MAIANNIQDLVKELVPATDTKPKTYTAEVSHTDDEGVVWVRLPGAEQDTPTASTSTDVKMGDTVTVEWRNNRLYIAGNYTNPSAGVERVVKVDRDAKAGIEKAQKTADDALSKANKQVQYFWTDEDGAHVTTVPKETFLDNPTGGNALFDSDSVEFKDGDTSLAEFGANGARVGKEDEAHTNIGANGMQVYGNLGILANIGYGEGQAATGTAEAPYYTFGTRGNTTVGNYSMSEGYYSDAIGANSHAEGNHTTASGRTSHAECDRTTASGNFSHAEGTYTTASGDYSHAEGFFTTASGNGSHAGGSNTTASHTSQTAIGRYNEDKAGNLFEIGNGSANANSNAFEVDRDGNTTAAGEITGASLGNIRSGVLASTSVTAGSYVDTSVTFSPAMSKAPVVVCSINSTSTSPDLGSISAAAINATKNGFTIRIFNNSSNTRAPAVSWIAYA